MTRTRVDFSELGGDALRALLRERLAHTTPPDDSVPFHLPGVPAAQQAEVRRLFPEQFSRAAVLVPIVERAEGLTVLFTERAATLRKHAGQISFPGGRMEATDAGPQMTALRETYEEIGLDASRIDVIGYMQPHLTITGFAVAPVVALVQPLFALTLDPREVASVFEVPLTYLLNPAHHQLREREIRQLRVAVYDIQHGERRIWGATAGILIALYELLLGSTTA